MKEKLRAFTERVLRECAQEGFTVEEVQKLPQMLQHALKDQIDRLHREAEFTFR